MVTDGAFNQFHRLIKKGDVIAIRNLLSSGLDVDLRNEFGWTPLMLAASEGQGSVVRLLLASGADVNSVNDFGASALAYAALRGEGRIIHEFLKAGAQIDIRPHGVSLLEFAPWGPTLADHQDHLEVLRKAGAS
jgi:ankyrin repeat protein